MEKKEGKPVWNKKACIAGGCAVALLLIVLIVVLSRRKETEPDSVGTTAQISIMDIMCEPCGITRTADGSLLVTDTYAKQIWKLRDGVSTVYAGGETVEDPYGRPMGGYNDALPEDSYFAYPWAIVPFLDGYAVSDTDNDVVRLVREDSVETVNARTQENLDMTDMGVAFSHPTGLASDEEGNLYIADTLKNAIRKVTPEGELTTFADNLSEPMGLCWKDGALYVAETGANRIVKIQDGEIQLVAGSGKDGMRDGNSAEAAFSMPQAVTVGEDGDIYVSDTGNSAIRLVQDGYVTTLMTRDPDDLEAFSPMSPAGLLLDGNKLYVCDTFSRKVFVISFQ